MNYEEAVTGQIGHNGKVYDVMRFTDADRHTEPCPECCFGQLVSVGFYPHIVQGRQRMINERGYKCNRPKGFASCTCINRKDGLNVYFKCTKTD